MAQPSTPIRVLIFTCRKPSFSPAEFQSWYLDKHMPLIREILGPAVAEQTILYFPTKSTVRGVTGEEFEYDGVTEVQFRDQDHLDLFQARYRENRQRLTELEEKFMDTSKVKRIIFGGDDVVVLNAEGQRV